MKGTLNRPVGSNRKPLIKGLKWGPQVGNPKNVVGIY